MAEWQTYKIAVVDDRVVAITGQGDVGPGAVGNRCGAEEMAGFPKSSGGGKGGLA
jgi:hypothetical protein